MFLSPVGLKFGITDVFKVKVPSPAFLSEFKGQERQVMCEWFNLSNSQRQKKKIKIKNKKKK